RSLALSGQLSTIISQLSCAESSTFCRTDDDCLSTQVCGPNQLCIQNPTEGEGCIANLWTGFGHWEELDSFVNRVSLQPNPSVTSAGLAGMDYYGWAEAPFQAPACVANGANCVNDSSKNCALSGVGCVGFRGNAIRIYIQVTDADDQCLGERCATFTASYAGAQLMEQGIKFIGLYGFGPNADEEGVGTAESTAQDIALASGTLDQGGNPLIYPALDADVVNKTVLAVRSLSRGVPLSVTIEAIDLEDDAGDALQFLDYLEVNVSGNGRCSVVDPVADTDGDSRSDAFPRLLPGTPVCWDVHPVASNTTVPAIATPQLFKARLNVLGDGSPLDGRNVFFLVPPDIYGQIN
ncbi:MAG: hypothetical protein RBU37_15140, partial [Myxococcota bacterium]|nr:hypothetical protein [Myxococcota bacterium]